MRYLVAALLLALEAVLQVSLFSRISLGGAAPQVVLLTVVCWSLAEGPREGAIWGFIGGLLYDLASGGPVGVSALTMVAVAAGAGLLGNRMFGANPLLPMVTVFGASLAFFLIQGFLLATLHYPIDWRAALISIAVPSAVANGLLSLAIYPLIAFVALHTRRQLRMEF